MVSRRSRPGSSSTTRMRALRLGEWGVASCMAASIGKPLGFPSLWLTLWSALVGRTLDVGNGIELGLRVRERPLETGILFALGSQALGELRDPFVRRPLGTRLQTPHIRLEGLLAFDLLQLQERESALRRKQSLGAGEYFTQKSLRNDRVGAGVARRGENHGITQHFARRRGRVVVVADRGQHFSLFGRGAARHLQAGVQVIGDQRGFGGVA